MPYLPEELKCCFPNKDISNIGIVWKIQKDVIVCNMFLQRITYQMILFSVNHAISRSLPSKQIHQSPHHDEIKAADHEQDARAAVHDGGSLGIEKHLQFGRAPSLQ